MFRGNQKIYLEVYIIGCLFVIILFHLAESCVQIECEYLVLEVPGTVAPP